MNPTFTIEEWNELMDLMSKERRDLTEVEKLRWTQLQTRVCLDTKFQPWFKELLERRWQVYHAFYVVLDLDPVTRV